MMSARTCSGRSSLTRRALASVTALVVVVGLSSAVIVASSSAANAGTPPNRLDDNRSAAIPIAATALIDLFAPFVCPPIACTGVNIGGRDEGSPKIESLYWDDNWDAHNPNSPSRATIDNYMSAIVGSDYMDPANQYGVSRGSFDKDNQSSSLCGTRAASGATSFGSLVGWVTCEVQAPFTGVPLPDDNTIYAVYVPEGVTITGDINATCNPTTAFHVWSAAVVPDPNLLNPFAFKIEGFPFLLIPAQCAVVSGDPTTTLKNFTENFSHELIEGALDPFAPTGWIDNSQNSSIQNLTSVGEPADICQNNPMFSEVPTPPVLGSAGFWVSTYWSNADNRCVPTVPTSTSLATSGSPSVYGQVVNLTATVDSIPSGDTPAGNVQFFDDATMIGQQSLDGSGHATLQISSLAVGDHPNITAKYQGQGSFNPSTSAPLDQLVNQAATTAVVTSSADPSVFGQPVTFTATVSPAPPSTNPATQPSGTVQFFDGATPLATETLNGATPDHATFSTTSLSVGTHDVTASYGGDGNYLGSTSSNFSQMVNQAPTQTSVTSTPNPSTWGQSVTFTATVGPAPPSVNPPAPPTGTITFSVNGVPVATEPVTSGTPTAIQGQASYSTAGLLPGTQSITATYNGDGNFLASTSPVYGQNVTCTSNAVSTSGSLHVGSTGSTCIMGITVGGGVVAGPGAKVFISNSTVHGALTAHDAALVGLCGSTVDGLTVQSTTGFVVIGDPADDGCAGNTIGGSVSLHANSGDAEVWSNSVAGSIVVDGTTGTGPFPDDTRAEIGLNVMTGSLVCNGNTPAPTNDGQSNTEGSATGQCTGL